MVKTYDQIVHNLCVHIAVMKEIWTMTTNALFFSDYTP